jgi:hypothetical protein
MNPFQRAEQAAREAARRRQQGNKARAYNSQSYKNRHSKPKPKPKPKTPPRTARPGPSPYGARTARPKPSPYGARSTPKPKPHEYGPYYREYKPSPIFEEYENNFHPETPPPRRPATPKNLRSNYQKALNYFDYNYLPKKTENSVREFIKSYRLMAKAKHPNKKGGSTENFQNLQKYYTILKPSFGIV